MSEPSKEIDDLENALKALRPAAQLDRDQLMYKAGQTAASRRGWFWPASTALMTAATAAVVLALVLRPQPAPQERVVFVPMPQEQPPRPLPQKPPSEPPPIVAMQPAFPPTLGQNSGAQLWHLEQQALRWGVDSLPLPPVAETSYDEPRTIRELMNDFNRGKFDRKQER
jgi:hypothetical protein